MPAVRLIFTLVFLFDAAWWYLLDRLLRQLPRARLWRGVLAVVMTGQMLLLGSRLIPPRFAWRVNRHVPLPLVVQQYLWHLGVLPATLLLYLAARGLAATTRTVRARLSPGDTTGRIEQPAHASGQAPLADPFPHATPTQGITRRRLVAAAAAMTPPLALAGVTAVGIHQLGKYRVRSMDLRIGQLPPALEGLTIAHLSDFHAGRLMTPWQMRPVIDTVNDMRPDLILITGDLIDYALADLPPALDMVRLLRPRLGFERGLAMCIGNHDIIENRFTFRKIVDQAGVPLLVDTLRTLEVNGQRVQLLGIDWMHGEKGLPAVVQQAWDVHDRTAFPILMAHHPHAFDSAAAAGFPLTLAGHTHGGQVMLGPHAGAGPLIFRYWSGLYRKPNGSQMVVSNGIGNWFPLRVNAPAEVIRLTLHRA